MRTRTSRRHRALGRLLVGLAASAAIAAGSTAAETSQPGLPCDAFAAAPQPTPVELWRPHPIERFKHLNELVKTQPYQVLFFGDSVTEQFDPGVWRQHMAPRGVFNAGINGDTTAKLLWRMQNGNLAGPPARLVILAVGTNDLRLPPEAIAEGIRSDLLLLRSRWPDAKILLLALWPRGAIPNNPLRVKSSAVDRLIRQCADQKSVIFADVGQALLDSDGRLSPAMAPNGLHPSAIGYALIAAKLDVLIDRLLVGG